MEHPAPSAKRQRRQGQTTTREPYAHHLAGHSAADNHTHPNGHDTYYREAMAEFASNREMQTRYGAQRSLRGRRRTSNARTRDHLRGVLQADGIVDREQRFASDLPLIVRLSDLATDEFAPAAEEAGVQWAGFHAFRPHCASRLIAERRNVVQVARWLGHHSPAFTLDVYAHLMNDGVGAPLERAGVGLGQV